MRLHPEVAGRDCADRLVNHYDKDGKPTFRHGKRLKRPPGTAPCRTNTGCPKGTPENNTTLTLQNTLAVLHYETCKATGRFPDDAIVARNAMLLSRIDREAEQQEQHEQTSLMIKLMTARV